MEELKWLLKFADKLPYLSLFQVHTVLMGLKWGERSQVETGLVCEAGRGSLRSLILVVEFILSMQMLQFNSFK